MMFFITDHLKNRKLLFFFLSIVLLPLPALAGIPFLNNSQHKACLFGDNQVTFSAPRHLLVSSLDQMVIIDDNNDVIRKTTSLDSSGVVFTLAGGASMGGPCGTTAFDSFCKDGQGDQAKFADPHSLAMDSQGNVYVSQLSRIRKISPLKYVSTVAGSQSFAPTMIDGDALTQATLSTAVTGLALDEENHVLYFADRNFNAIRKLNLQNNQVTTIAGGSSGYQNGPGASAKLKLPTYLLLDQSRNCLYVSDTGNHSIRKIQLNSPYTVSTLVGVGVAGYLDGWATNAQLNIPKGLALDSTSQNLYIADSGNERIRKLDFSTNQLSTYAGSGQQGYVNGPLNQAKFHFLEGLVVDENEDMYVADEFNHVIRRLSGNMVSTFAGNGQQGYQNGYLMGEPYCGTVAAPGIDQCHVDQECQGRKDFEAFPSGAGGSSSQPPLVPPIFENGPPDSPIISIFVGMGVTYTIEQGILYSYEPLLGSLNYKKVFQNSSAPPSQIKYGIRDVTVVPDVNHDLRDDFAMTFPTGELTSPYLMIGLFYGATGKLRWQAPYPGYALIGPSSLIGTPDINGDGTADVLFSYYNDFPGEIFAYSGVHGSIIWQMLNPYGGLGQTSSSGLHTTGVLVKSVDDFDNDGRDDLIFQYDGTSGRGFLPIHSSQDGSLISAGIQGENPNDHLNFQSKLKDINSDGKDEIIACSLFYSGTSPFQGKVYIYSGDGTLLWSVAGDPTISQRFCFSASAMMDVNSDGKDDVVVGAKDFNASMGKIYVYSGANGQLLWTKTGEKQNDAFGFVVKGLADINEDQQGDIVVAAPGYEDQNFVFPGRLYVLSGKDGAMIKFIDGEYPSPADESEFGQNIAVTPYY
jgi:DNA-binding beta-propeller fold protein YncE